VYLGHMPPVPDRALARKELTPPQSWGT